jgi:hypothetical protein
MSGDVERVAKIFCLSHGYEACVHRCDACVDDAKKAMRETLLIAAEALQAESGTGPMIAPSALTTKLAMAHWLTARAQEVGE